VSGAPVVPATRAEAVQLGLARGRRLDQALAALGYQTEHGELEGARLAARVYDAAQDKHPPEELDWWVWALDTLARPAELLADKERREARLHEIRATVRPADPLELLCQLALGNAAYQLGEGLYVGELAALARITAPAVFKAIKLGRLTPRTGTPLRVSWTSARDYLKERSDREAWALRRTKVAP